MFTVALFYVLNTRDIPRKVFFPQLPGEGAEAQ